MKKNKHTIFDIDMISGVYRGMDMKIKKIRSMRSAPLTCTEKILFSHLDTETDAQNAVRGKTYCNFRPDRVAMQDATAQMAILQFMLAGKKKVCVPATVHTDHLIIAKDGAESDLCHAKEINREVYDFLASAAARFGIGYWEPGSGIIHQILFENYAFPGGMMIGTDSHTVTAGGLCMAAAGVGGADAVDVLAGMSWELKMPRIIGVCLTGKLSGWATAKDVSLFLLGHLTVKGGTGAVIEYFGPGAEEISCTGKGTICNMGAEIGATGSVFPYDKTMADYLRATHRDLVAQEADACAVHLRADPEVYQNPEKYYDSVIEIDLNSITPYWNGPYTPDAAWKAQTLQMAVKEKNYPQRISAGLIGSCTNSSFEDLSRAASVARDALEKGLTPKAPLYISPGSLMTKQAAQEAKLFEAFEKIGAVILSNACGPCIGQWTRENSEKKEANSIVTSFNRNFSKRADGNPNTYAFVASAETVIAAVISGKLGFDPAADAIQRPDGASVKLAEPSGHVLPANGFPVSREGYLAPDPKGAGEVIVAPDSKRLQLLVPFPAWDGKDIDGARVLIKVRGKCTTDHISAAGKWLAFRGHLDAISGNLLIGAVNDFNGEENFVWNSCARSYMPVPDSARRYKAENIPSVIIGDENYGEGSSREHAAMEPRHLGVRAVITRSFARIHETNLKKQGMLALTFSDPEDYNKIHEDDIVSIRGLSGFTPESTLSLVISHSDGIPETIQLRHNYNLPQISWLKAGSALNFIKQNNS